MKKLKLTNIFCLLLAAVLWGFAFTAQKTGIDYIPPVAFNCLRSYIGALFLIPCLAAFSYRKKTAAGQPKLKRHQRTELIGGLCCGIVLAAASTTQQLGIQYTTAGKSGFITACYIILVPLFGRFMKKPCSALLWVAVALAVAAMYLLCMTGESFTVGKGDLLTLLCAVLFALHIITVDFFVAHMNGIRLSLYQFTIVALVLTPPMLLAEGLPALEAVTAGITPLLYAGIMSCGVAYTLQIIGQKNFNPTVASLIMSLESTFAVLGGWLLLDEHLTPRQFIGCAVMMLAIILAQLPHRPEKQDTNP